MKVLTKNSLKQIMFNGENFQVPEFVKFVAVDADGLVNGFRNKPEVDKLYVNNYNPLEVWIDPDCGDMFEMGTVELEGEDWRFLLTEV